MKKNPPLRPKLSHDLEIRGLTVCSGVETTYKGAKRVTPAREQQSRERGQSA
jgi:hypothetical protein